MNLQDVYCPYPECPDKGEVGKGNVVWYSRVRKRCKCRSCGRTFSYRRGTLFYGLRKAEQTVTQVVTLLAYGCPCQAIVAAFGLDERTVMDWQGRAGAHARAVHEAHIGQLDLQAVQADEMRIRVQGQTVLWVAMAIMVSTRLWLGAVISPKRDRALIETLAQLVRRWAKKVALYITFDGFSAYRDAFERAFSDKALGRRGKRLVNCVWACLTLAQVVKHSTKKRFAIQHYILRGSPTMLARLRTATQLEGGINTAFIERLNGTFRAYLAPFVRRTHGLARTQRTITAAVFRLGAVYNFCRVHSTLKHSTPAMAAHLTDHVWSVSEFLWFRPKLCFLSSTV
jgi:transposase-like protein/IS1 family transposase